MSDLLFSLSQVERQRQGKIMELRWAAVLRNGTGPCAQALLSFCPPPCPAVVPCATRLKGGSFRAWDLSYAISESRFSLEPYAFRRCGDFHGGWLCTLVFYILLCQNAWLCTSAAAIWHHLAGELRSYCSVQGGPLLWSRGDGRGGRARPALVALLPLDSVTAALGRCHCCSQTLVVQSVWLGWSPGARYQVPLPFVIFDILSSITICFLGK